MRQQKKKYLSGVIVAVLFLAGCGVGSDTPEPLGLFDNQQADQNQNQNQTDQGQTVKPSQFLSVSDVALEANLTERGSAGQSLAITPSFGLDRFLSEVGKATEIDLRTSCRSMDAVTEECTAQAQGQTSGDLEAVWTTHFTEMTSTRVAGTIDFTFRFNRFAFDEKSCGASVTADGTYSCHFNGVSELVDDNTNIDFRFNGLCNTAEDSDHLMDVTLGGQTHKIGYDLALDYQIKVPHDGENRNVYLNEANITGTIQIDGVNYAYGDLKSALGNSCGQ